MSDETKDTISKTMKGRPSHGKGKTLTEEHERKISKAMTGENMPRLLKNISGRSAWEIVVKPGLKNGKKDKLV